MSARNSQSSSLARPSSAGAWTFTLSASPSQPTTALRGALGMALIARVQEDVVAEAECEGWRFLATDFTDGTDDGCADRTKVVLRESSDPEKYSSSQPSDCGDAKHRLKCHRVRYAYVWFGRRRFSFPFIEQKKFQFLWNVLFQLIQL